MTLEEGFTGIIIPSGLDLPEGYECGMIVKPDAISRLNRNLLLGHIYGIGISGHGKTPEEVGVELKGLFEGHVRFVESNNAAWIGREDGVYREYFNFVRTEYIQKRVQLPRTTQSFDVDDSLRINLQIFDLSNYNVQRMLGEESSELTF